MFETILVPVDENICSMRAVASAAELARRLASRVLLLHVVTSPGAIADVEMHVTGDEIERLTEEHGNKVLDAFQARVPSGVEVKRLLRRTPDRVWQEILAAAEETDADLIVMGTHGREGVVRAVMGSVAERVARHAEIPVMLVR